MQTYFNESLQTRYIEYNVLCPQRSNINPQSNSSCRTTESQFALPGSVKQFNITYACATVGHMLTYAQKVNLPELMQLNVLIKHLINSNVT